MWGRTKTATVWHAAQLVLLMRAAFSLCVPRRARRHCSGIRPSECCLIRRKGGRGVRLYLDRRRAGYESQFRLRRPRLCKILLVVNGIEAIPTTRLNEMIWFEETLQRVGLADGPPAGGRYLLPQNAAMSSPTHRSIQPAICAEWARWCHLRQDLSAHVRMARLCA